MHEYLILHITYTQFLLRYKQPSYMKRSIEFFDHKKLLQSLFHTYIFQHIWPKYRLMHEKRDKSILRIFINEKFRKLFYFFTCILPNYLTHESQKDFWKNSHFENTRAGFLLWCQNSLWQNTSKMMHFQAWKNKDFMQYYVAPFDPIKIFTH